MMAGEALLLKSLNAPPSFEASPARFYVLFAFCLLSFNQCLFWITFSPIAGNAKEYYGIDDGQIALLLNWGPIIYIPVCGVTSWLTSQKNGLRRVCLGSGVATAVAMVVRCVPSWRAAPHGGGGAGAGGAAVGSGSGGSGTGAVWPQDQCQLQREGGGAAAQTIGPLDWIDVGCLHFAQIVNAAVGPPVMASPSLLSAQWFPDQERNRATAAAILSNNFGAAMGALVPSIFDVHSPGAVPRLLYIEAGLAVGTMLLVLAYFPARPSSPPSASALAKSSSKQPAFLRGVRLASSNGRFMVLAAAGGSLNGVFNTWSGSFDQVLPPLDPVPTCAQFPSGRLFPNCSVDLPPCAVYTQDACGWVLFVATMAVIVGGFGGGAAADVWLAPRRAMKPFLAAGSLLMVVCMAYFTFALPSPFPHMAHIPSTEHTIVAGIVLAALFMGAISPVYYELGVEMTHPQPEVISNSICTLWNNFGGLCFLAAMSPLLESKCLNLICLGMGALCLLCFAVFDLGAAPASIYRRRDAEEATMMAGAPARTPTDFSKH